MTSISEMLKDIATNCAGGVFSWAVIGVLVVIFWTLPKMLVNRNAAKRKKRAEESLANMNPLLKELEVVLKARDPERCQKVARVIQLAGFETSGAKGRSGISYIEGIVKDIKEGRFSRLAAKCEAVKMLREDLRPYTIELRGDKTKARIFINTCGELIKEGYEVPIEGTAFSDLELELIKRIEKRVREWKDGLGDALSSRSVLGYRILMIGGLRIEFAREILKSIYGALQSQLLVSVYRKSSSGKFMSGLEALANESGGLIQVGAVDDAGDARVGYDIMISAHYWQHRQYAELLNSRFHLTAKSGLLIWLSASSRGAGSKDIEYVCEGFPPLEPNPCSEIGNNGVSDAVNGGQDSESPFGVAIPYTKMGAYETVKSWIKYELLNDAVWGGRFFYEHHFPRSYKAEYEVVQNDFNALTSEFLEWYFSDCDDVVDVRASEVCREGADLSARERFGDGQYIICAVSIKRKSAAESFRQYMIAVVGNPDEEGECIVSLHPCVRSMVCTTVLSESFLSAYLEDERLSDQHNAAVRTFVPCAANARVFRVISRISCPIAKHYIFALEKTESQGNNRYLYVACVPSRTFLTANGYEAARKMLVDYDARIEGFLSGKSTERFCPYRMDSVTILMPYLGIRRVLDEAYSIRLDDDSVFFHKCYGKFEESAFQVVPKGSIANDDLRCLQEDAACIDKDRAFNKIDIEKRLQLLGCMNVHDVLLFGVKNGGEK